MQPQNLGDIKSPHVINYISIISSYCMDSMVMKSGLKVCLFYIPNYLLYLSPGIHMAFW